MRQAPVASSRKKPTLSHAEPSAASKASSACSGTSTETVSRAGGACCIGGSLGPSTLGKQQSFVIPCAMQDADYDDAVSLDTLENQVVAVGIATDALTRV